MMSTHKMQPTMFTRRQEFKTISQEFCNQKMPMIKTSKTARQDTLRILFRVIGCLDIRIFKSFKNCSLLTQLIKHIYPILSHLIVLHITIVFAIHMIETMYSLKTDVAFLIVNGFSLFVWHLLHRKRKTLKIIYNKLQKYSKHYMISDFKESCAIRMLLSVDCVLVITASSAYVMFDNDAKDYCIILSCYSWTECDTSFIGRLYIFSTVIFTHIVTSLFSNIIAMLYCVLCYRCSKLLCQYRQRVQAITHSKSQHSLESQLGTEYLNLLQIVEDIQLVFSLPSLLVFLISFMHAFISLGDFMLQPGKSDSYFFLAQQLCLHIPSGICTMTIPVYAAKIHTEMIRIKTVFQRMFENMNFLSTKTRNQKQYLILSTLKDVLILKMSAWDMIEFTGTTVPAVLGTFITYGLLVLNVRQ